MDALMSDREQKILAREGIDPVSFETAVEEIAGVSHATVSESEHDVLTSLGISVEALTPEANAEAQRQRYFAETSDRKQVLGDTLGAAAVADLLGLQGTSQVRTMLSRGDLYAIPQARGRRLFPRWQFVGSEVVPHLRDVLAALPEDLHPLDLWGFMDTPEERLGGRTPLEWLITGGAVAPVVDLAEQQQHSL